MELYQLSRSLLFRLPAEGAHHLTLSLAARCPQLAAPWQRALSPRLKFQLASLTWRTPVGLAAGLDKDAQALEFFDRLGFGSLECGTVTLRPQAGNPKPRMFRYPAEASLRNSMGFPSRGADVVAQRLAKRPPALPLLVNIGKSKNATPAEAIDEYAALYEKLAPLAEGVVVNISSPNTQGLRDLQQSAWLQELFAALAPLRARLKKPLAVKLAPDLEDEALRELCRTLAELGADALVATNTTHIPERGVGGVSGRLLRVKAHQKRKVVLDVSQETKLPVIGVGGIESMSDVWALWAQGGSAFQVYTSFVYQGPPLLLKLEGEMLAFLERAKLPDLASFFALSPSERQKLIAAFATHR